MRQNRLDAVHGTLDVVPDTADKSYGFYIWQVVTFTATVTVPGGVADGRTVIFNSIGNQDQDKDFVYYDYAQKPPDPNTSYNSVSEAWQVVAHSEGKDPSIATATIRALYSSTARGPNDANSFFKVDVSGVKLESSVNKRFTVVAPNVSIEQMLSPYQLLPASSANETPLSSAGNYFICNAYISDPKTRLGLKNICWGLSTTLADHSFTGVAFYPALQSVFADALKPVTTTDSKHWADVLTDMDGVATVYVCAAKTFGTYAGVIYGKCGVFEMPVCEFVIPDFSDANPNMGAPQIPRSPPVQVPATGADTIACTIPAYQNNAVSDRVFVLCNSRVQRVKGSNVIRGDNGTVSAVFSKFGLRNTTFDDNVLNKLAYIVLPTELPAKLSSSQDFSAQGDPGTPTGSLAEGETIVPSIVETLGHGVVINTDTIANGLTVRVPVGNASPDIPWDNVQHTVSVTVNVSGWMSDYDDPMASQIISSQNREVRQVDIDRGHADIWFPRIEFWGFGQSVEGVMGHCEVQYTVIPGQGKLVKSKILRCHIDTLPPSGVGAYFE